MSAYIGEEKCVKIPQKIGSNIIDIGIADSAIQGEMIRFCNITQNWCGTHGGEKPSMDHNDFDPKLCCNL